MTTALVEPSTNTGTYVQADALADALHNAALCAGRDVTLPVLCAVQLTREGDTITAAATNRYLLGVATVPVASDSPAGDWSILIDTADVKRLVVQLRTARRIPVILDVTDDKITLNTYEVHVSVRGVDGQFPRWDRLIPTSEPLAGPPRLGFTPTFLAVFAKVKGPAKSEPVYMTTDGENPNKPIRFKLGDSFSGLIMPVRIH